MGAFKVEKFVPDLKGYVRIAPCFYVASSERGMAGKCILQVRAQLKDSATSLLLGEQEILLTDGPCPFVPGTLEISALNNVKLFELRCGRVSAGQSFAQSRAHCRLHDGRRLRARQPLRMVTRRGRATSGTAGEIAGIIAPFSFLVSACEIM